MKAGWGCAMGLVVEAVGTDVTQFAVGDSVVWGSVAGASQQCSVP